MDFHGFYDSNVNSILIHAWDFDLGFGNSRREIFVFYVKVGFLAQISDISNKLFHTLYSNSMILQCLIQYYTKLC